MRKTLIGTTALVAAGLAAGQASAASGLKLGITGFYRGSIGATIGGNSSLGPNITAGGSLGVAGFGNEGRNSTAMRQEIRLNFTGETTLDNGITVGVLVGINAENLIAVGSTTTPQKRSYADFKGKFGDIRFGEYETALTTDCVVDPGNVTANFGVNSPNEAYSNAGRAVTFLGGIHNRTAGVAPLGSIGTCYGTESRGTKIGYFSPTFGGFTFGVTYTPTGSTRNPGGGYFYGTDLKNKRSSNVISFGADYNHDFGGGFTLTTGGGGEWALDSYSAFGQAVSDKPSQYLLGVQVGIPGGFTVGASGAYIPNYKGSGYAATDAFSSDNGWVATAGAAYTIDAVSVGLQGMYSEWDTWGTSNKDKIWAISLNGAYALGPGINLEAQVMYNKYDANTVFPGPFVDDATGFAQPGNYDAVEVDGGFAINF